MTRPAPRPDPKAKPKSLAQQQTDFTAEGSPPPGKVATAVPDTKPAQHAPDAAYGADKGHPRGHPGKA